MADKKINLKISAKVQVVVDESMSMEDIIASMRLESNDEKMNVNYIDIVDWN